MHALSTGRRHVAAVHAQLNYNCQHGCDHEESLNTACVAVLWYTGMTDGSHTQQLFHVCIYLVNDNSLLYMHITWLHMTESNCCCSGIISKQVACNLL